MCKHLDIKYMYIYKYDKVCAHIKPRTSNVPRIGRRRFPITSLGLQPYRCFRRTWFGPRCFGDVALTHEATSDTVPAWHHQSAYINNFSIETKVKISNIHSGFCSSHFFFLFLQVWHPVFVRLLKTWYIVSILCLEYFHLFPNINNYCVPSFASSDSKLALLQQWPR